MPIFDRDMRTIRRDIALRLNDRMLVGTAVSGGSTAGLETFSGIQQDANLLVGKHLYFDNGALAQESRAIYAATTFSPGSATGAVISPIPYFSGAPSTTSEFMVTRRIPGEMYTNAIQGAVRRAASKMLQEARHHEVLGSPLRNGLFSYWPDSSVVPPGWTQGHTGWARQTQNVYPGGRYSVSLSSTAVNIYQDIPNFGALQGQPFTAHAAVHNGAGLGHTLLQIDDGVGTTNSAAPATGDAEISVTRTISLAATRVRVGLLLSGAGGGNVPIFKKVWADAPGLANDLFIPPDFVWLSELRKESGVDGIFNAILPDRWYYVNQQRIATDATQVIAENEDDARVVFLTNMFDPGFYNGQVVELVGQKTPAVPSAETDTIEVDPEYIMVRAMEELYNYLPWGENDIKAWQTKYATSRRDADRFERELVARPQPGSVRIRQP